MQTEIWSSREMERSLWKNARLISLLCCLSSIFYFFTDASSFFHSFGTVASEPNYTWFFLHTSTAASESVIFKAFAGPDLTCGCGMEGGTSFSNPVSWSQNDSKHLRNFEAAHGVFGIAGDPKRWWSSVLPPPKDVINSAFLRQVSSSQICWNRWTKRDCPFPVLGPQSKSGPCRLSKWYSLEAVWLHGKQVWFRFGPDSLKKDSCTWLDSI